MIYDLAIIGGGPAGLTAAVYARRAEKSVIVMEKATFGGQITFSPKVENIPGFVSVSGNEFAEKLVSQALEQGADVEPCEVTGITDGLVKTVHTDSGDFQAKAVVVATGAKHRRLGVEREENFIGEGISFCAVCDGAFYKDRVVGVVGGGNSALQEALLLSDVCKKVFVFQNLSLLTGEEKLQKQLREKENVEVLLDVTVRSLNGDTVLTGVTLDRKGEALPVALDGLFVAIGLVPQNEPFADLLGLDARGYADADETCKTATPGIFVAGDCRTKQIRQVATAVADGAVAALAACNYLDSL